MREEPDFRIEAHDSAAGTSPTRRYALPQAYDASTWAWVLMRAGPHRHELAHRSP
ncbi:hypothetical protein ACFWWM_12685 [Streptomyces sp. NPDC058682]|uniref:hypothetical protein n=1 Tax=unclassified Streptomyces TaxID=2593676 RepID=UPI00224E596D|nr:hypothetical protein [Streptomyces sp. NBC_01214]MCX4807764.1 hypothetical protein [Streptomyces sp. NBC_01214]